MLRWNYFYAFKVIVIIGHFVVEITAILEIAAIFLRKLPFCRRNDGQFVEGMTAILSKKCRAILSRTWRPFRERKPGNFFKTIPAILLKEYRPFCWENSSHLVEDMAAVLWSPWRPFCWENGGHFVEDMAAILLREYRPFCRGHVRHFVELWLFCHQKTKFNIWCP